MKKPLDMEQIRTDYEAFIAQKKTVMLSLIDELGQPFASIAACVQHNGKFYVYISKIAEHFQLLEKASVVDALFVADEAVTPNHFATERVRWQCKTALLGNEGHEGVFAKFDEVHNAKMMTVLKGLDFSLFELMPLQGRYVVGFGKAFDLNFADDTMTHVVIDKKEEI